MKNIITKIGLFLSFLFIFILASCSNQIEVGFGEPKDGPLNLWYNDIRIGLKSDKISREKQKINVYYGITYRVSNAAKSEGWDAADFNQKLKFSLYRQILNYGDFKNIDSKVEIYSYENTLEYFMSEDFYFKKSYYTDEITIDDLINDNNKRIVLYHFELKPIEDEYIKICGIAKKDYTFKRPNGYIHIKKGELIGPNQDMSLLNEIKSYSKYLFYGINNNKINFWTF